MAIPERGEKREGKGGTKMGGGKVGPKNSHAIGERGKYVETSYVKEKRILIGTDRDRERIANGRDRKIHSQDGKRKSILDEKVGNSASSR